MVNKRILSLAGRAALLGFVLISQLPMLVPAQVNNGRAQQTLAAGSSVVGPGGVSADKAGTLTGGVQNYAARLDTDLFVQEPIQLRGVAAGTTIDFVRPRDWTIQSGTELQVELSHSEALIPDMSYLTISINHTTLKTVTLDKSNVLTTLITVPVPPELLQDYNKLEFAVAQHYTRDCEDPFNASLWTRINKESRIYFVYKPTPPKPDLSLFPAPFYDDLHYGPTQLQYMMPSSINDKTLRAMATINAALAQVVNYRPMETSFITSLSEAKSPVIVVGTSNEPEIGLLTGGKSINGPFIEVLHSPSNPLIPVLVISGKTGDDVVNAARIMAQPNDRKILNGDSAQITNFKPAALSVSHSWPGYIPDQTDFTLADMKYPDVTVKGFFSSPITMDFRSIPDYKFLERNQTMSVHYRYSAQLQTDLSTMEVRIDGIVIHTYPLLKREGEERTDKFQIPSGLIHPNAKLGVQFHLYPIGYDPCKRIDDQQINATLYKDTSFSMEHDRLINLPDLEAFRNGGFPFTEYQDMHNLLIVLPANPNRSDMQVLMNVSTRLGRLTKSDGIGFDVALGKPNDDKLKANNLIVIGTPSRQDLIKTITTSKQSSFALIGSNQKQLKGIEGDPALQADDFTNQGVIQEVVSPWNEADSWYKAQVNTRTILVLTGRTDQSMELAGKAMVEDKLFLGDRINNKELKGIEGDLALVQDSGTLNSGRTASYRTTEVSSVGVWRGVQLFAAREYYYTIAAVIIVLFLAFLIFRAILIRYRNREMSRAPVRFTS